MQVMRHLFLLLFALSAWGQPAPINRRAMAIAGLATTGFQLPNYTNLWIDLDDSTLVSGFVSNWVDRIHGITFTNRSTNGPIMGATGPRFFATNFLRKSSAFIGGTPNGTNAFFVVFQNRRTSVWGTLAGYSGAERGLMMKIPDFVEFAIGAEGNYVLAANCGNNVFHDVIYLGGTNRTVWTNGVYSTTLTIPAGSDWVWDIIGGNQASSLGDPWIGEIRKIVWWTNSPTTGLSTNDMQILHTWATNTYGYTP